MNSNYENLPKETRKVMEKAINTYINGVHKYPSSNYRRTTCVLLLTILKNDESLQKFLNKLDSEFMQKLEKITNDINGTKMADSKTSTNYEEDYFYCGFKSLINKTIEFSYKESEAYKKRNDRDFNLNFLSPNLLAFELLKHGYIKKIFAEIEGRPKDSDDTSEYKNSLRYKFKNFLAGKLIEEKSVTITKNGVELDVITPEVTFIKENADQDIVSQSEEDENVMTQTFEFQNKEDEKKASSIINNPEEIKKVLTSIKQKFIGQEEAAKLLFLNIIKNQKLVGIPNIPSGTRSIMFIDGPSGTGKTAITKDITDNLGLPFVATSITNYSASGYVGGNITDILKELYVKSGGDLGKAQRGIVVLDELDKIVNSGRDELVMKTAVQHQLLDFLGGGKYTIEVKKGTTVEFDTSKITFVCLGALTNLRNSKTQVSSQRPMGFNVKYDEPNKAKEYSITPDDLIEMGLEKELVGRFNIYIHTKDYSKEDLKKILLESKISPLIGFTTLVSSFGKKLVIDDGVYDLIANAAYDLNTGARSLQTVVNNLNSQYLEELLMGVDEEIHITAEDVKRINDTAFKEKGRH